MRYKQPYFIIIIYYLACSGLCDKSVKSVNCPLNFTLGSWTCLNYPAAKTVLSVGDDGQLALAIVKKNNMFSQEIFSCENGQCTTFDKVCNLLDDCGDLSDEKGVLITSSATCQGSKYH